MPLISIISSLSSLHSTHMILRAELIKVLFFFVFVFARSELKVLSMSSFEVIPKKRWPSIYIGDNRIASNSSPLVCKHLLCIYIQVGEALCGRIQYIIVVHADMIVNNLAIKASSALLLFRSKYVLGL